MVRCKMVCIEKKNQVSQYRQANQTEPNKPTCTVVLYAVSDDANKTWARYTPCGRVELAIDNPDAYEAFVLGETYFVDFTVAPAKEADEK